MIQRLPLLFASLLLASLAVCGAFAAPAGDGSLQRQLAVGGRDLSITSWLPEIGPSRGVILFSHGYASAPWKYEALVKKWVEVGFEVHAPLHVDSTDHPRQTEFRDNASWAARLEDMRALADDLGNQPYIAAGHSYGALMALTLGGADAVIPDGIIGPLADPAVSVVLAFSPPPVMPGLISKAGYATLSRPALIQTGTRDVPMGSEGSWEKHLDAYHAAAAGGGRYSLVLSGVDHYFGGAIGRPELPGPKQLAELATATDLAIWMIEAYAEGDSEALKQLQQSLTNGGDVELTYK